jgi:hypothetical protein
MAKYLLPSFVFYFFFLTLLSLQKSFLLPLRRGLVHRYVDT